MRRLRILILLLALALAGCSGGSDSGTAGGGGATGQPTGTVVTNFTLLRAVPSNITDYRFFFFNAGGNVVFGPTTVAKATQVTLTGVPTTATTMRIEYLQDGTIRGIASLAVVVTQGGTTIVNDPPFQDVGSQVQAVIVTPFEDSTPVGTRVQYVATAMFFDGTVQDVTSSSVWTSSNEAVATVSNSTGTHGRATGVSDGTVSINATFGGVAGAGALIVRAAELASLQVTPANSVIANGTTQAYQALGLFTDGTTEDMTAELTWTTSDSGVAQVDVHGVATGVGAGSADVTATHTPSGIADSAVLNVTAATLTRIDVSSEDNSVPVGYEEQFIATGHYSDGTDQNITSLVAWSSTNTAVAVVSNAAGSDGRATALAEGATNIVAAMPGTAITGTAPLNVSAAVLESIEVAPFSPTVADGEKLQFEAIGTFSDNTTQVITQSLSWRSSDPAVAQVANALGLKGLTFALSVGQADIIATDSQTGLSGSSRLTVGAAVLQSVTVTPSSVSVALGAEVGYTAFGVYSDSNVRNITSQATWTSSDDSVASVSNTPGSIGLATTHATGTTDITATLNGVSGSGSLTVTGATLVSIAVTPVDSNLPLGMRRDFVATGTYSDASTRDITHEVTWNSSNPTIAGVSNNPGIEGRVTARSVGGPVTITARKALVGVSGTTTVTVTPAVLQSITVTPGNQSVSPATIIPYTATGNYSDGSTLDLTSAVTWRSSSSLRAIISNHPFTKGVAISVLPGNTTISARLPNLDLTGSTNLNVQ